MAACEKLSGCPFYQDKMDIDSAIGKMYKRRYCEGDKTQCARYKVATTLGGEYVTSNLFPNMMGKAEEIIKNNR